jgi:hypothetical protein
MNIAIDTSVLVAAMVAAEAHHPQCALNLAHFQSFFRDGDPEVGHP